MPYMGIDDETLASMGLSDLASKTTDSNLTSNIGKLLTYGGVGTLLNEMLGGSSGQYAGYKGGIPRYYASRTMNPIPTTMQVPATETTPARTVPRRPGSGGITYFTPMVYSTTPPAAPAAPAAPVEAAGGGMMYAMGGGISSLGSYSDGGRLLRGPGDGVSDSIPATIGAKQPARLADGEFVIPARIVSELGNGSTEAGARKLYAMMNRIKKKRRAAKDIAADTKADKELPA